MTEKALSTKKKVLWWAILGSVSALTGLLAQTLQVPAAWLVGPMLIGIMAALVWPEHPRIPRGGRVASLAVVGGVLAATFTPSVVPLIAANWLPVCLVVSGTLALSLGAGLLLARIASLESRTATLGTLPGAASGMLAMSGPLGADPRLVAVMQYTRVAVVVFSAALVSRFGLVPGTAPQPGSTQGLQSTVSNTPVLFHQAWQTYGLTLAVAALGAWAGTRLRLPAGALMGPLLCGIALEELGVAHLGWPPGVPQVAFLILGLWVGLLFDRTSIRNAGRLFPLVLASAAALTAACAGLGWMLSAFTGIDGLTAYLATTPGGIDSVAIMALGSEAQAPLVLAVQMLRLFAVIIVGAIIGRRWS
ncbi:MAG: AbrB family transcriptional regulator [Rubrobacter sp.]|nr:AbrB family transcriptional regulator [Rubrobacter sp.]